MSNIFISLIAKQILTFHLKNIPNQIYERYKTRFLLHVLILLNILRYALHKLTKSLLQIS